MDSTNRIEQAMTIESSDQRVHELGELYNNIRFGEITMSSDEMVSLAKAIRREQGERAQRLLWCYIAMWKIIPSYIETQWD